jgi:hypothetical protein
VLQNAYGFSGQGSGIEQDPYVITDVNQLQEMNNDLDAWYELGNDIDASDTINWNYYYYYFQGFVPIGGYANSFIGTFDGKGHVISNLYIAIHESGNIWKGLFGETMGNISNVGLTNISVEISQDDFVGGLAGQNRGKIENSFVTGSVIGDDYIGGLVGVNQGTISNSYATGNVIGVNNPTYIGGLVGLNQGTISNSYATGNVSGTQCIGGLAGYNSGTISNSYATGNVIGDTYVGGLAGRNIGDCTNSYWDINTSGQSSSEGGEGKTTAEMKQIGTFTNWDFVETWGIEDNQTYPFLKLTYPAGDLNHDKVVNFLDFAILADHWLEGI